ncbi:hypothetical protein [Salmonella phage STWB21]|uniref:Uncharacterized protein n=1 Tax=Salmonella phage STWB21 TaxID=2815768 RepID=A0A8A6RSJ3_9CAUD|nr:hypothetical protein [Salmonella phage STWB21]
MKKTRQEIDAEVLCGIAVCVGLALLLALPFIL